MARAAAVDRARARKVGAIAVSECDRLTNIPRRADREKEATDEFME